MESGSVPLIRNLGGRLPILNTTVSDMDFVA